jgi:SOS-response transcriptional repressor LexA
MKNHNEKIVSILAAKSPAKRLSEMLNQLMIECAIDGVQLSKNTGVPVTTINRLRKGDPTNNPTLTTLVPLSEFFTITVSQLIGDEPLSAKRIEGEHNPNMIAWKSIPHLAWEQVELWLENKANFESKINKWTATDIDVSDKTFAITMEGDSMYPRFPEGTLFIIEPEQPVNNRDFVVILPKDHSKPLFKQILIDGSDYYIKSLSKDFKEIKKISLNEDHKIIGVMIQARTEFKR